MIELLGISLLGARIWYAVPLLVAISLVQGATRHELLPQIFSHSLKSAIWILAFMAVVFAVIFACDYFI